MDKPALTIIRVNSKFFENKSPVVKCAYAETLERRVEKIVKAWMLDTGVWDVKVYVEVLPAPMRGHFLVVANVDMTTEPLRDEAGGFA